jgi:hypothetical protein
MCSFDILIMALPLNILFFNKILNNFKKKHLKIDT